MADDPRPPAPRPPGLSHAALTAYQAHDEATARQVNRLRDADDQYSAQADAERDSAAKAKPSSVWNVMSKLGERVNQAANARPSYKDGIDRVPETGPANLHEGEAVLNKEDAGEYRAEKRKKMKKKKASEVLGGGKKKSGKKSGGKKHKVHRMSLRHAANGGYIAEHQYKGEGDQAAPESQEFQLGDMDQLQQHVGEHMSQEPGAEEAAAQPAAPPPDQPQQPPVPGAM